MTHRQHQSVTANMPSPAVTSPHHRAGAGRGRLLRQLQVFMHMRPVHGKYGIPPADEAQTAPAAWHLLLPPSNCSTFLTWFLPLPSRSWRLPDLRWAGKARSWTPACARRFRRHLCWQPDQPALPRTLKGVLIEAYVLVLSASAPAPACARIQAGSKAFATSLWLRV